MEGKQEAVQNSPPERGRFQYSLRTLFVVMTASAVLFSGLFAGPIWVRLQCVLFMVIALPAALTAGLIHGRGYTQTFCTGSLFPAGMTIPATFYWFLTWIETAFTGYAFQDDILPEDLLLIIGRYVAIPYAMSLAAGLLAVGVRRVIEGPRRQQRRQADIRPETTDAPQQPPAVAPYQPQHVRPAVGEAVSPRCGWPTLLVVVAGSTAVLLALCAGPNWMKTLTILSGMTCLPAALTTGLIYGRGYARTFCIGGLFPAAMALLVAFSIAIDASDDGDPFSGTLGDIALAAVMFWGIPYGMSLGTGLLALGVRRIVEGPSPPRQQMEVYPSRRTAPTVDSARSPT